MNVPWQQTIGMIRLALESLWSDNKTTNERTFCLNRGCFVKSFPPIERISLHKYALLL
jgi:hypothetical protein